MTKAPIEGVDKPRSAEGTGSSQGYWDNKWAKQMKDIKTAGTPLSSGGTATTGPDARLALINALMQAGVGGAQAIDMLGGLGGILAPKSAFGETGYGISQAAERERGQTDQLFKSKMADASLARRAATRSLPPIRSGSARMGGLGGAYGAEQKEDARRRQMQREMEAARERELATQQRFSRDDMKFKLGLLSGFMKPSNERDVTYKETQQIVNNAGRYDKVPVTERIDAPAEDYRRQLIQLILGSQ